MCLLKAWWFYFGSQLDFSSTNGLFDMYPWGLTASSFSLTSNYDFALLFIVVGLGLVCLMNSLCQFDERKCLKNSSQYSWGTFSKYQAVLVIGFRKLKMLPQLLWIDSIKLFCLVYLFACIYDGGAFHLFLSLWLILRYLITRS